MERFLDMHMYITSALQKTDMKAVGLQLALDLLHKKVRDHSVEITEICWHHFLSRKFREINVFTKKVTTTDLI